MNSFLWEVVFVADSTRNPSYPTKKTQSSCSSTLRPSVQDRSRTIPTIAATSFETNCPRGMISFLFLKVVLVRDRMKGLALEERNPESKNNFSPYRTTHRSHDTTASHFPRGNSAIIIELVFYVVSYYYYSILLFVTKVETEASQFLVLLNRHGRRFGLLQAFTLFALLLDPLGELILERRIWIHMDIDVPKVLVELF